MSDSATRAVLPMEHRPQKPDRLPTECAGQPADPSVRSAFNQPMGDLS